jgi:hypothetical protein
VDFEHLAAPFTHRLNQVHSAPDFKLPPTRSRSITVTQGDFGSVCPKEITMKLPQDPRIQEAYADLLLEDRMVFEHAYAVQSKGLGMMYLSLLVASHYAYLGRWNVQFAYWFTGGGLLLWMLADVFRLPGMVNEFNKTVALNALKPFERQPDGFAAMMLEPTPVEPAWIKPAQLEPSPVEPKWITPTRSATGVLEPVPSNHAVIELLFQ